MARVVYRTLHEYFINLKTAIVREDFPGIAAEMAFMLVLGFFPFMLFLTAVFGWLGKKFLINNFVSALSNVAPGDVVNLAMTVMREVILFQSGGIVAFVGFFVTLFLASNAVAVIIKGLNRAARVKENRTFIQTWTLSVLMVCINTFLLFISMNLVIFGRVILQFLSEHTAVGDAMITSLLIVRWPLSFLLLFVLAVINYYVLPARDFSRLKKSVVPGALFFCIFWLLGSWLFSLYVGALGTYNIVYGTIGAFAILMVWLYYTSIIMLIGGEINNHTLKKLGPKG
ncbi:virulence factor BrkB superfamily [Candidatus Gastranaerophilus sp. (ex Termes propinquus)]|nr:virulence factor BrkB superfamily [Candidatus Gastranaerophilus sp. (ex Termes propinquus)]